MFIKNRDSKSSDYLEFQYIKNNLISNKQLLKTNNIEHFKEDSIYVKSNNLEKFEENYLNIFDRPETPDGNNKFYSFGINLYTTERLEKIYNQLKQIEADSILLDWLKLAVEKNYRIYILGL